jgi:hypothetical protein
MDADACFVCDGELSHVCAFTELATDSHSRATDVVNPGNNRAFYL